MQPNKVVCRIFGYSAGSNGIVSCLDIPALHQESTVMGTLWHNDSGVVIALCMVKRRSCEYEDIDI